MFGAALGALGPLVALPFALASYRIGFSAGLSDERLPQWFLEYLIRIALDAVLGALVVAAVLALVERVRVWYLIVMALLRRRDRGGDAAAGAAAGDAAQDHAEPSRRWAREAARGRRARHAARRHRDLAPRQRDEHDRGRNRPDRTGVVGDVTLVHLTAPELRVALAHDDVHVRYEDPLRQTLMAVTLFVLSAAAAVLLSDRVGFRRDDDALSRLALVATFLGLVTIVTYPIYNAYARNLETRADRESLAARDDRAETVRALVRYADVDLVPLCDRRSVRWYFDDRPALGGRIAAVSGTADPCPGGGPATAATR